MKLFTRISLFLLLVTQICFAQWYKQNSVTTKCLNDVVFLNIRTGIAVGDSGLILRTTNDGRTWVIQSSGTNNNLNDVFFNNSNSGYAIGDNGTILNTTDGGVSWLQQSSDTSDNWNSVYFIDENNGWVCGAYSNTLVYQGGLIKTIDGGINWVPQPTESFPNFSLSSIDFINEIVGWVIYVLHMQDSGASHIYKTTDGGLTWNLKLNSLEFVGLNDVKFINQNNGIAVGRIRSHGIIYRTTDSGETWDVQDFLESGIFRNVFLIDEAHCTVVGDNGGIYMSTDFGENWVQQFTGTNNSIKGVHFVNELIGWAVGDNGTILHTTNGGVSFIDDATNQPTTYFLSQNYPNPFNPSTKIKYSVPQLSKVIVKVFDVLGNELETIVNQEKSVGTYEITWFATNLPSGVYFYQLKAGEFTAVKKMLLLK